MAFNPPDLHAAAARLRAGETESPEDAKIRFTIELEFVQALGNPLYLGCEAIAVPVSRRWTSRWLPCRSGGHENARRPVVRCVR